MPRNHEMSWMVLPAPAGAMPSPSSGSQVSMIHSLPLWRANLCLEQPCSFWGLSEEADKHEVHQQPWGTTSCKYQIKLLCYNLKPLNPYTTAWAPWKTGTEVKALDFYLWNAETDAGLMWFPSLHCAIHSLHYKDSMRSHSHILSPFRHSDP